MAPTPRTGERADRPQVGDVPVETGVGGGRGGDSWGQRAWKGTSVRTGAARPVPGGAGLTCRGTWERGSERRRARGGGSVRVCRGHGRGFAGWQRLFLDLGAVTRAIALE